MFEVTEREERTGGRFRLDRLLSGLKRGAVNRAVKDVVALVRKKDAGPFRALQKNAVKVVVEFAEPSGDSERGCHTGWF